MVELFACCYVPQSAPANPESQSGNAGTACGGNTAIAYWKTLTTVPTGPGGNSGLSFCLASGARLILRAPPAALDQEVPSNDGTAHRIRRQTEDQQPGG